MLSRILDLLRRNTLFAVMLLLVAATTFGCYDSDLNDPYDTAFTQRAFTNLSTQTPRAVAAVSGQAAHISLTNRFIAPTLQAPGGSITLDSASGRVKASFTPTNLSALDNGAFYELWVMDGSTSPAQKPISLGKFNLDATDGTIITYTNPTGTNPVDSGSTTYLFSQVGIPTGATHTYPIDILNGNSGNNIMVVTIENPGDSDYTPSSCTLLKASISNLTATMSFPHTFTASTGYATISTSPAGTPKGTLTLYLQNWPDISTSGFTYQVFVVSGGIYTAGARFKSSGGSYETVISDFTMDLTTQDRVEITIEPEPDYSAANFPLIPANGAIVQNAVANSTLTLISSYLERVGSNAHYELWSMKSGTSTSLGKFNVRTDGSGFETPSGGYIGSNFLANADLTLKDSIYVTLEQPGDADSTPSQSVLISGSTAGTTNIAMSLPFVVSGASGTISIGSQAGGVSNGYLSLQMKGLPDISAKGFRYEAWIESTGAKTSAGKFDSTGSTSLTAVTYNASFSILSANYISITVEPLVDFDQSTQFPCTILRGSLH